MSCKCPDNGYAVRTFAKFSIPYKKIVHRESSCHISVHDFTVQPFDNGKYSLIGKNGEYIEQNGKSFFDFPEIISILKK